MATTTATMPDGSPIDLAKVAKGLMDHLIATFKFEIHDKESSDLMKAIATGMDLAKTFSNTLPSSKDFMERFATTAGEDVFLPKVIRENPVALMEVGTHECQHTLQFKDTNVQFAWFYLTDNSARAQFEADAYAAGIIVRSWLTGEPAAANLDWAVQSLISSYHLRPEDASYAKVSMKALFASWESGIIMVRSAREAIKWLEANYPQLKGAVQG